MTWAQAGCNGAFPAKLSDDQLMISWISADRPVMPFVRPASADIIPGNSHAIQLLKIINFFYKKKRWTKMKWPVRQTEKNLLHRYKHTEYLQSTSKILPEKSKVLKISQPFFLIFFCKVHIYWRLWFLNKMDYNT